jgi:acyl-CoA thioesterase FadM
MPSRTLPHVIAADRRAAKFGIPAHETDAARAIAFKRAIELMEWAQAEFIRAGRDDAARAALRAIDTAEAPRGD